MVDLEQLKMRIYYLAGQVEEAKRVYKEAEKQVQQTTTADTGTTIIQNAETK